MAIAYNTSIIKDGLVLCLDAANPKSYPGNLGAELVTTSTVTQIDGTTFNVIRDAGQNIALSLCNVESGKTYYVDYLITSYTGTVGATFRINNSGANLTPTISVGSTGRFNAKFTASVSGGLTISGDNSGTNFLVDYVSVREVLSGSGTTWFDISGNGKNSTLTNGPTYDGQGIVFDGVDDSSSSNLTGVPAFSALTVNVWFYSNVGTSTCLINNLPFILHFRGAGFYLRGGDGVTDSGYLAWQTSPSGNVWNMLTGTWNGSTMKLYLNGNKQSNELSYSGGSTRLLRANEGVTIGGYFNASQPWTNGKISNVKIYNRALTDLEIRQNFEGLRGRYGI